MAKLNYVELPVTDVGAAQGFFSSVFGWSFTDYGPTYAAAEGGEVGLGLQGDPAEATAAPLPVIEVEALEATAAMVVAAGGRITQPIFAFPGGRRFHFQALGGNELAAIQRA